MEKQDAANPALRRRPETSRGGRQMPGNRSTRLSRLEARGSQIGAAPPRSLRMHVRSRTAGRQEKQSRTERRPLPSSVPAASDGTLRAIILTACIAYVKLLTGKLCKPQPLSNYISPNRPSARPDRATVACFNPATAVRTGGRLFVRCPQT